MDEDGEADTQEGLEADIAAIKAAITQNEKSKKGGGVRYQREATRLKTELDETVAALSRLEDPGGLQRIASKEEEFTKTMEKFRQASIRELEAAAQADEFREQVGKIRAEIEQLRSEQKVAATAAAVQPTPVDMVAACGSMQLALEGLYATPGLPEAMSGKPMRGGPFPKYFVQASSSKLVPIRP